MKFNYKGKEWDTDENNRLQVTEDDGLKEALIQAYSNNSSDSIIFNDYQGKSQDYINRDLLFQICLLSARYTTIIEEVTGGKYTYAGTYPEWVINAANEYQEELKKLGDED